MAFKDLTSRQAVLDAIAECDRLGRETFLAEHGFGEARQYFLVHEGQRYDSKAIVGVAHGYQFPTEGALDGTDFAGGEATVRTKLKSLGFEVIKTGEQVRNPPWVRDELILALDLYFRGGRLVLDDKDLLVIELSEVLNALPHHRDRVDGFRNPSGVAMKLGNFRRLDPEAPRPGGGLTRGNSLEPKLWEEFAGDPVALAAAAAAIRSGVQAAQTGLADDEDDDGADFPEGRFVYRTHRARERSQEAVRRRKAAAKGDLRCQVCAFDFKAKYGEVGVGYIECHHVTPVSELQDGHRTRPEDLALVCANCHRMLHRRRPWLSLRDLQRLLSG